MYRDDSLPGDFFHATLNDCSRSPDKVKLLSISIETSIGARWGTRHTLVIERAADVIIGIDLGTTNSLVASWNAAQPELIPNVLGNVLTPSVVGFDDDGETVLVGSEARDRLITKPELTAAVFKRYMGTDRAIRLGARTFRPEELASFLLRALKADAEASLGIAVEEAVITVPAYFSDAQRKATRNAGHLAGLKVDRLLNEPTAAALSYGLHERDSENKFLVFDLGGGTFGISVLELFEGVFEVRASAGDNFLGGEDFDELLAKHFAAHCGFADETFTAPSESKLLARIFAEAERIKRRLTIEDHAVMKIEHNGRLHEWAIAGDAFEQLVEPLLERLRNPVERALRDARIRASDLDEIVLAGGATKMPVVRRPVSRLFGRLPASHLNPDEIVAKGAAIQAGLKMHDAALDEVVMTDICPYTLGIEVAEQIGERKFKQGFYLPIIERNCVVPISRVEEVSTLVDGQREILVEIYQGESRFVADNIFLGKLNVRVPPKPAGEVSIEVRFTYDVNGLLEVDVDVPITDEHRNIVIEDNPGVLTAAEIEQRLAALSSLKLHPRDVLENRALLARANRVFEESLASERVIVGVWITDFSAVLESQDLRAIAQARNDLESRLDELAIDPVL